MRSDRLANRMAIPGHQRQLPSVLRDRGTPVLPLSLHVRDDSRNSSLAGTRYPQGLTQLPDVVEPLGRGDTV